MKRKAGVVYLLCSCVLVAIILTLYFASLDPTLPQRESRTQARVLALQDFIDDFHRDAQRASTIAAFHAFIALEEQITRDGRYIPNLSQPFTEAFFNGTINGTYYPIMQESTFNEYLQRVQAEAARQGIALSVAARNVELEQRTPWTIMVHILMEVNLTDRSGAIAWSYDEEFVSEMPIYDLRDPLFGVGTLGRVPNTIRRSPLPEGALVQGGGANVSGLFGELQGMYYREDPSAPSFLQRFSGRMNESSKYGIASLVDLDTLNAQGLTVNDDLPSIDYLYFGNGLRTTYCPTVGAFPGWFRIDEEHYNDPTRDYGFAYLNATLC